ncbi:MAG: MlaD family protein [Proteobacteria bacterium]|jgi:phospholipid/cholesterol/gamma-HCH transport system substrate-binding protein|nr:MlaD family protein [Pseudomonadota bacterium]
MTAGGRDERHLELKVGAMILVALVLLVTFVLILGDWSFGSRTRIDVYFQNPGGLAPGAAVKVAGRKVGTITEMTYLGQTGPLHPTTLRPALVRTLIEIEEDVAETFRSDARFYITTKGLLGDPFMEIDPGVAPTPFAQGQKAFGTDPPRLDLFLADAAELITALNELLRRNAGNLDQVLGSGARLLGGVDQMLSDGGTADKARVGRIADNLEGLLTDTRGLVQGAREKYVDDPGVARTLDNMEEISAKLNREIDPLIKDVREALVVVDRLGDTLGPEEQKSIKDALNRLDDIAVRADNTLASVDGMVQKIRRGEGTAGQLLSDEEIYDDLKELIRDIKHHPWKLIWED